MALKDILVHLDPYPRSDVRGAIAVDLAGRYGAHLTGLFVIDIPSAEYLYGAGIPMGGLGVDQMIGVMIAEARAAAEPVEARFRETLRANDLQGEWRLVDGHTETELSMQARASDLVVVGQPNDPQLPDNRARVTVETVLMSSGRPVLTIPFAGDFSVLTDHILIAWNASREATRAVHDALPLLRKAGRVTVLAINPRGPAAQNAAEVPQADIAAHLARHGVPVETALTVAEDITDGDALLSYASDLSANLIVAGAYGHSRARELIFGGVTRTLLAEMTVPIFFSH